jgi:hypothetical protein
MYWYHELLDMPTTNPFADGTIQQDHWDHYGRFTSDRGDNWHYLGGSRNQLLPLVSRNYSNSPAISLSVGDTESWTNLGGCHGSSGSGVFHKKNGFWELLGPVSHGNFSELCSISTASGSGNAMISYVSPTFTRQLASVPEVMADRSNGPG